VTFKNGDIYSYRHVSSQWGNGGRTRSKSLQPMSTYYVQARTYSQFYLETRRHRLSYKNPRKKEQARKPLLLFRAGMTEGAPRDRAGYLATLVVTRWVLVRVGDPWCLRLAGSLPTLQRLRMAAWWVKGLATRPTLHCRLAALQGFSHELLLQRSRPTNPTTTLHFLQLSTGSLSLSHAPSSGERTRLFYRPQGEGPRWAFSTRNQRPPSLHL